MKNKVKWLIAIICVLLLAGGAFLIRYLTSVQNYQDTVAGMTYQNIDARQIPDGTYLGECDVQFISAKVSVTVEGEKIIAIDLLEHRNDRGDAATGIEQRIVEQQRIDVDAVSGATNSSTGIKKAVDNALSGGLDGGEQ